MKLLTYAETKANKTEAWFSDLLRPLATSKRIGSVPYVGQLLGLAHSVKQLSTIQTSTSVITQQCHNDNSLQKKFYLYSLFPIAKNFLD